MTMLPPYSGDSGDETDQWRRIDVLIDRRGMQTLDHLRRNFGASYSGAIRASLELIRKQMELDP